MKLNKASKSYYCDEDKTNHTKGGSSTASTSKMKLFVTIVNGFQLQQS